MRDQMLMNPDWDAIKDEDLMVRFRQGDAFAFERLFERYRQPFFRYFLRYLHNREAAEEATQEVFLHMIRAARHYQPKAKFSTWAFRIVHNYGIDCFRRNRLRKTVSLETGEPEEALAPEEEKEKGLETRVIDQQLRNHLSDALERINPEQREVFLMREDLGLSFQEIAKIMGVSTNTVKSRMRYALTSLKKILSHRFQPLKEATGT